MCVTLNSDGFELAPGINTAAADSASKQPHAPSGDAGSVDESAVYRPDDVRTPRPGTWQGTCIKGRLTGKSTGTKRPTFSNSYTRSGKPQVNANVAANTQHEWKLLGFCLCTTGKIDLSGAEAQALESGGVSLQDTSDRSGSEDGSGKSAIGRKRSEEADMTLIARGNVRVETMSWIQIIRSKYGFEDKPGTPNGAALPRGGVGRTASASALAAEIAQSALNDSNK